MNGTAVRSLRELRAAIDSFQVGDAVVLQIERRGRMQYLGFEMER